MAIEEEMMSQQGQQEGALTPDDEQDLELAVLLGKRLIDDGGAQILESAKNSSDAGQVIGQFLLQLGSQMGEQMPPDAQLSPAIFLARGGWLEQMSDFIEENFGIDRKTMDRAEVYVASTAQQMAQKKQGEAQPGVPAQQPPMQPEAPQGPAPVMPQGAY